ncbi:iron-containing alcohol dehydrogenase [Halieaceae bacterium IMCC14734]|uniref:Iron-containing alcohol dehydrogenase n=1 Tax=Candidatus Litorirhabdus singularis TaxID=2518993 RepID=A0ABT3TE31_9GAMM|nr:iron-containing alcohol dehydrogenase [Candidatus Litorirhabdus singularis]MCX2980445.1 iron-containing alcohol dehydrogenase [Candidatus Litorirhabdus singularis]
MPAFHKVIRYKLLRSLMKKVINKPQPKPAMFVGPDSSLQLCGTIAHFGVKKILLVTDRPIIELGLHVAAVAKLNSLGVEVCIYDEVKPDPTVSVIEAGIKCLKENQCDAVLAFGGGSSMDSAKVIAMAAGNNLTVPECMGFGKAKLPTLPLFAIPTTAGTGSEATMAAIVSDDETHAKNAVADFKLVPSAAALDPSLMLGLPPHITAATGMDALTHAVESYTGVWSTPETDHYCLAATKLIFENIETAYSDGQNIAAREAMALASYYAGLAFTQAMVGYVHAISHQLGAHYGIAHGVGNAMALPPVMEMLKGAATTELAELAVHVGLGNGDEAPEQLADRFIGRIWELNDKLGIPRQTELIQDKDIPVIVAAAMKEGNGYPVPRFIENSECEALLRGLQSN